MEQEEQRAEGLPEETAHVEEETLQAETAEAGRPPSSSAHLKTVPPPVPRYGTAHIPRLRCPRSRQYLVYVKGSSMEPNFYHGDLVFMEKLSVRLGTPQRGDVVICRLDNQDGPEENIIKRVIGLPGDEIDIVWNGDSEDVEYALYRNGELVIILRVFVICPGYHCICIAFPLFSCKGFTASARARKK